jgi:DNA-binding CsgD family transcriptional regulator
MASSSKTLLGVLRTFGRHYTEYFRGWVEIDADGWPRSKAPGSIDLERYKQECVLRAHLNALLADVAKRRPHFRELVKELAKAAQHVRDFLSELQATPREYRPATVEEIRRELDERVAGMLDIGRRLAEGGPAAGGKRKGKGKRRSLHGQPLTDKQREILQVVSDCKGNKSEAARRLNLDPSTVRQQWRAGMEKLGRLAVSPKAPKKQRLPSDRRGQADLSEHDDKRRG